MNYYHGLISSRKASAVLIQSGRDGDFLVRDSQSQPGNFVLSARYGGKVYHIMIFHENTRYFLDSGDGTEAECFTSLDDLVMFGMAHELSVAGEEVHLNGSVPCRDKPYSNWLPPVNAGQKGRLPEREDSDQLTDLFAAVFGTHCAVLVMVHSSLKFDAQPLPSGQEYLCCIVKDSRQKAFFIRTVDPVGRRLVGEKKITKNFEYDNPSDCVLTFLSEHGITCVGFRDVEEQSIFLRHLDRIVQLQNERAVKVRDRNNSNNMALDGGAHTVDACYRLKAEEFDIHNLTSEWQYLFEQAGVTQEMLEDEATLQFMLDTVCQMGGAPQKLKLDARLKVEEGESLQREERAAAIAVDTALRHESLRASRLADELRKRSLQDQDAPKPFPRKLHAPKCSYSSVSTRYKDWLLQRSSLSSLSPIKMHCYCSQCGASKPAISTSGDPPEQYTLPIGWCQYILRSQTHQLAQQFCSQWHVAFSVVPSSSVPGVVRTGQLLPSPSLDGLVALTPQLPIACQLAEAAPSRYYDETDKTEYQITTAFQVFVQPGSYQATVTTLSDKKSQKIWLAPDRTYIPYALLILILPTNNS